MTPHDELVERAALWLAVRCPVVVTELVSSGMETPDAIGWATSGHSTLVECKISRSDFRRDAHKAGRRLAKYGYGMGDKRYYLAPKGMIDPDELPAGYGLLEPFRRHCKLVIACDRPAPSKSRGTRDEFGVLLSLLRRFGPNPVPGMNVRAYTFKNDGRPRAALHYLPLPFGGEDL